MAIWLVLRRFSGHVHTVAAQMHSNLSGKSHRRAPRYWSAVLLAIAAVVLLVVGNPSKDAVVGAGFAFLGAAVTRGIDLAREHRTEAAQAEEVRRRDLDETRRVVYMALASQKTQRYELAATIVNALAHHQSAIDPDEAMRYVTAVVNGGSEAALSEQWLRGQIQRISAELGST